MKTEVLDGNVVAIPESLASQHCLKSGSRLDWKESGRPDALTGKVPPDDTALAMSLMGTGRKHLQPGAHPKANLGREGARKHTERQSGL